MGCARMRQREGFVDYRARGCREHGDAKWDLGEITGELSRLRGLWVSSRCDVECTAVPMIAETRCGMVMVLMMM